MHLQNKFIDVKTDVRVSVRISARRSVNGDITLNRQFSELSSAAPPILLILLLLPRTRFQGTRNKF